jgi:hypothetical protein
MTVQGVLELRACTRGASTDLDAFTVRTPMPNLGGSQNIIRPMALDLNLHPSRRHDPS